MFVVVLIHSGGLQVYDEQKPESGKVDEEETLALENYAVHTSDPSQANIGFGNLEIIQQVLSCAHALMITAAFVTATGAIGITEKTGEQNPAPV